MSEKIPSKSTYVAPFNVNDTKGNALDLSQATVKYRITESAGGVKEVVSYDETDDEVTLEPEGETGKVKVEIPATETDIVGEVWEELRISFSSESSMPVVQRKVYFGPSTTDPPST
jgi:hypothetical protein